MKKSCIMLGATAGAIALLMTSCGTTQTAAGGVSSGSTSGTVKETKTNDSVNNTTIDARKMVTVDWKDRSLGQKETPDWLLDVAASGDGDAFAGERYPDHKWFCNSARERTLANAQTIAQTDVLYVVASSFSNLINAVLGQELNEGQKSAIRNVCANVRNVKLVGVGERGNFWKQLKITDENGKSVVVYDYYSIWSCSQDNYITMLKVYMKELVSSKDLDEASISAVSKHIKDIGDAARSKEEAVKEQLKHERKMELEYERTKRLSITEDTKRQNVKALADSNAQSIQMSSSSTNSKTTGYHIDPAMESLYDQIDNM